MIGKFNEPIHLSHIKYLQSISGALSKQKNHIRNLELLHRLRVKRGSSRYLGITEIG